MHKELHRSITDRVKNQLSTLTLCQAWPLLVSLAGPQFLYLGRARAVNLYQSHSASPDYAGGKYCKKEEGSEVVSKTPGERP